MRTEEIRVGDVLRVREWDDMAAGFGADTDGDIASGNRKHSIKGGFYMYSVTFRVLESGETVERTFGSPYLARNFALKIKHSKRCALVSTMGFLL